MPELPEVEAQRLLLAQHLIGRRIIMVIATEQGGGPRDGLFDEKVFGEADAQVDVSSACGRVPRCICARLGPRP